jgi:hypothetical protein
MYCCVWKMVNEVRWMGQRIYECEICGFAYTDLETAERCEQYCYSHGHYSPSLTRKAVRSPREVDPIAAA